jgi:hypothetical protein
MLELGLQKTLEAAPHLIEDADFVLHIRDELCPYCAKH